MQWKISSFIEFFGTQTWVLRPFKEYISREKSEDNQSIPSDWSSHHKAHAGLIRKHLQFSHQVDTRLESWYRFSIRQFLWRSCTNSIHLHYSYMSCLQWVSIDIWTYLTTLSLDCGVLVWGTFWLQGGLINYSYHGWLAAPSFTHPYVNRFARKELQSWIPFTLWHIWKPRCDCLLQSVCCCQGTAEHVRSKSEQSSTHVSTETHPSTWWEPPNE